MAKISRKGASTMSKVEARTMSSTLFEGVSGCNVRRRLLSAAREAGLAIVWSEVEIRKAFLPDI